MNLDSSDNRLATLLGLKLSTWCGILAVLQSSVLFFRQGSLKKRTPDRRLCYKGSDKY